MQGVRGEDLRPGRLLWIRRGALHPAAAALLAQQAPCQACGPAHSGSPVSAGQAVNIHSINWPDVHQT